MPFTRRPLTILALLLLPMSLTACPNRAPAPNTTNGAATANEAAAAELAELNRVAYERRLAAMQLLPATTPQVVGYEYGAMLDEPVFAAGLRAHLAPMAMLFDLQPTDIAAVYDATGDKFFLELIEIQDAALLDRAIDQLAARAFSRREVEGLAAFLNDRVAIVLTDRFIIKAAVLPGENAPIKQAVDLLRHVVPAPDRRRLGDDAGFRERLQAIAHDARAFKIRNQREPIETDTDRVIVVGWVQFSCYGDVEWRNEGLVWCDDMRGAERLRAMYAMAEPDPPIVRTISIERAILRMTMTAPREELLASLSLPAPERRVPDWEQFVGERR